MTVLEQPIANFKGIGPSRAAAFAKAGIITVSDALHYYPRGYQNRSVIHSLNEEDLYNDNLPHAFLLTVSSEPKIFTLKRGMTLLRFRAFDETATVTITLFNQTFYKSLIHTGELFRVYGKINKEKNHLEISSPILEAYRETAPLRGIVPVYPLVSGLSQKIVSRVVEESLRLAQNADMEYLPIEWLEKESLPSELYALHQIHNPTSESALLEAKKRMTFDEIFLLSLASLYMSHPQNQGDAIPLSCPSMEPLIKAIPFAFTNAQKRCISEIQTDLSSSRPMNRILTGDVGSGKTIVAATAIYQALFAGKQAAFMAPTEILARQHFADLAPLFRSLGFTVELLIGALTPSEKKKVVQRISQGESNLVIGTHALLTENVTFSDLALVITDEQHRFGVKQREILANKTAHVHALSMTATPIPRTLSLIIYGNVALSKLDELPPGRQKVDTFVVDESYRSRLDGFIEKQASQGYQTYIVCPSIEENEETKTSQDPDELSDLSLFSITKEEHPPLKAAITYAAEMRERLPHLHIGFVHGKMKSKEKEAVMNDFHQGLLDVLVSTTVIEVGVNVPSATLMIVENAERFGLSQLHQLRGRVGRGSAKSYCILVSDAKGENAKRRLEIMKQTNNGFEIAEKDLELRGPGDFLASGGNVRQSGEMLLPFASACLDRDFLQRTSQYAQKFYEMDITISSQKALLGQIEKIALSR